jgi:general secretion pathway protein J
MSDYKRSAGFTLIEVLIAMTLLGIMVVLLFSSMKICAESWQKGEDKITQVNDVAVVYQFFQHHLGIALPLWDDFSEEGNKVFAFQGRNQSLQFVSSFPASAKKAGLQRFSLDLIKDGDEQVIQVSITPFYPVAEGEEWRKEEVDLLRHVRSFSLNYYNVEDPQAEGMWQEDWLDQETLPRLVKIKIERDDGSFWPEMSVELKSEPQQSNLGDQDLSDDDQTLNNAIKASENALFEEQGE